MTQPTPVPEATPAPTTAPEPAKKSKPAKMKHGKVNLPLILGIGIPAAFLLQQGVILVLVGMLPSIVARIVDRSPKKHIFWTVTAMNFSGMFPYLLDIMGRSDAGIATAQIITDFTTWLWMYSAAAMGWVLVWVCPLVVNAFLHGAYRGQIMHFQLQQKKLIEEWGVEVTKRAGD